MQINNKKIMIIGAGQMQVPAIKKCHELKLYTIVVDQDKNAPGFKYANKSLLISTHNNVNWLKKNFKTKA